MPSFKYYVIFFYNL